MSAGHTPGSIRYDFEPDYCGELIASNGTCIATFCDEPSEEDARRLVACWNACEGLSTDALERLHTLDRARVEIDVIRAQAIAQRDELLEALKLADCLLSGANMNREAVERKVRAAIAKVTGVPT